MAAANEVILTISDYQNPRLEGFSVPVPLRSESGDLYSIMLYLSANGYGARELAMNVGVNPQVGHWWLGHLHAQPSRQWSYVATSTSSKVTDEFTKWTAVYFLTSKNQALQSLQLLIGLTVVHFGGRIVCWRSERAASTPGKSFGSTD